MLDFQNRGAGFKRALMADVQDYVVRMLSTVSATIAAQKDGSVVSDQHRVLNFQGSGVTVADDAAGRRVNVFIAGTGASTTTTTIVSNTTAKSQNVSPPTTASDTAYPNWKTVGFSDAAWGAVVAAATAGSTLPPAGSAAIWDTATRPATDPAQKLLIRQTFTLPTGTILGATLDGTFDAWGEIYVNGTYYGQGGNTSGSGSGAIPQATIPPSVLIAGGTNVIAVEGHDVARSGTPHNRFAAFKLLVTSSLPGSTYSNQLAADVTLSTLSTFFDGPTITVPSGRYFLHGVVTCSDAASFGYYVARLWDGTNTFATSEQHASAANYGVACPVSAAVSPAGSTTYKISVASNSSVTAKIKAATPHSSVGNVASWLIAVPF